MEAPGIEHPPERSHSPLVNAHEPEKTEAVAIEVCSVHATVSAESKPAEPIAESPTPPPSRPSEPAPRAFDVARATGLAEAVGALLRVGAVEPARPIVEELIALLRAAQGPGGAVVDLASRRRSGR